jgi:hypothetical protein
MHHLGRMYAQQGRFDEAEAMMRRTIEGEQKRFGPDYPGWVMQKSCCGVR